MKDNVLLLSTSVVLTFSTILGLIRSALSWPSIFSQFFGVWWSFLLFVTHSSCLIYLQKKKKKKKELLNHEIFVFAGIDIGVLFYYWVVECVSDCFTFKKIIREQRFPWQNVIALIFEDCSLPMLCLLINKLNASVSFSVFSFPILLTFLSNIAQRAV